jgi:hypothetical protein
VETSEAAAAGEEAAVAGDVVAGETIADDEAAPTGDAKTDQT